MNSYLDQALKPYIICDLQYIDGLTFIIICLNFNFAIKTLTFFSLDV